MHAIDVAYAELAISSRELCPAEWRTGTALIFKQTAPYTLPWEKLDGDPRTVMLLFRWMDDQNIRARTFDELV